MDRKKIIGGGIIVLAVLSLAIGLLAKGSGPVAGSAGSGSGGLVGIIEINGTIVGGDSADGLFGGGIAGSETVMEQLREVSRNPNIKAVVLRINSPGGTPAASQEITDEINRLKASGIKIVTSMGDVAASGAYWIASASDKIVANPGTITGSIGVIIQAQNYRGLMDKLGVSSNTIKSGDYKDMGSPERSMTEEEKQLFQSMVDDTYNQFIETVAAGRNISPEAVRGLKGRVLTGRQAIDAGLVDQPGNLYEAISVAGEISGLGENPDTINLGPQKQWWRLFDGMGSKAGILGPALDGMGGYYGVLLYSPVKI